MAESSLVSKWFTGSMVSFSFSLSIGIGCLASAANGIIMPLIYNEEHTDRLGEAFLFGAVICFLAFAAGVILSKSSLFK